jgi:hypothetical protein
VDGEQKVSTVSDITVFFNNDIDPSTFNRELYDYGSSNGIDITVSGHIKNIKAEEMGEDFDQMMNIQVTDTRAE